MPIGTQEETSELGGLQALAADAVGQPPEAALAAVKLLLESSVDAAVVIGPDRQLLYSNPAYRDYTGRSGRSLKLAEARGEKCYDCFRLEICETACLAQRVQALGHPLRLDEISARRADGDERTLIVSAFPFPGGVTVESYRDVTSDARLQRKYKVLLEHERRANDRLEQSVAMRTDELRRANEELRRTQAQLIHQEKMSSLGRLVAGIAHELNNPINFVYGNVDFLARYLSDLIALVEVYDQAELPPASRETVEQKKREIELDFLIEDSAKLIASIRSGAERTAGIVRDLKAFSRAGGGALQEADLIEGLETTLNLVAPLIKNRITIEREYQPIPRVICHPGHIHQVFMNVITNAAQAIRGPGRIRLRASVVPAPAGATGLGGDRVRLVFMDTGPGVPENIRPHIFDPFFTTKDPGEGTGLGLAISEGIMKSHGGRIELCPPEKGWGAVFLVELPISPISSDKTGERTAIAPRSGQDHD
jgi:signal transduction histidine kinase